MQCLRQVVTTPGYTPDLLDHLVDFARDPIGFTCSLPNMVERYQHEGKPLADIVMQVARDPCSFGLLGLNQFAAQGGKSFFGKLTFCDVGHYADHSLRFAVLIEKSVPV